MAPPTVNNSVPASTFTPSDPAQQNDATVQLGETNLAQVAQRLGVDVKDLQKANPQIDPGNLKAGQDVHLPTNQGGPKLVDTPPTGSSSHSSLPSGPMGDPLAKMGMQYRLADSGAHVYAGGVGGPTPTQKHDQWIGQLAADPAKAHQAWKNLSSADRDAVTAKMTERYGKAFTHEFKEAERTGKTNFDTDYWQPGVGPDAKTLAARGYKLQGEEHTGNAAWVVQDWVHPSGKTVRRDVSTYQFGNSGSSTGKPTGSQGTEDVDDTSADDKITDQQDGAEQELSHLEDINQRIESALQSKPVNWDDVHRLFSESNDALGKLKQAGALQDDPAAEPSLDMSGEDDDFYTNLGEAQQKLLDLRGKADEMNPNFEELMQQPVVEDK
jgi:murein DD-endopeptidase MepM/ murein hydrolase activator NlpD